MLDGMAADRNFWFEEELWNVERVEVLKGPASILYGQGSLGGTVQLVSKRPRSEWHADALLSVGMFGNYEAALDFGGPLAEDKSISFRVPLLHREHDSFTNHIDPSRREFIAPSLTWKIAPDTTLTFQTQYLAERTRTAFPLPAEGTVLPNPNGRIDRELNVGEPDDQNFTAGQRGMAGWLLDHRFSPSVTLHQGFRFMKENIRFHGIYPYDFDQVELFRYAVIGHYQIESLTTDTHLQVDFSTGPVRHKLLAGVDYYWSGYHERYDYGDVANLNVFNPVYGNDVTNIVPGGQNSNRWWSLGFYVQDQLKPTEHLTVLIGGRFDLANAEHVDQMTGERTKQDDDAFSPRIGATYEFLSGVVAYSGYSESFLPQGWWNKTVSGEVPKPETGREIEAGFKTELWDGRLTSTLAVFQLTRRNVATGDPTNPGFVLVSGEQRSRGGELDATWKIVPGWELTVATGYTKVEVTKDEDFPVGDRLQMVPDWAFNGWMSYRIQEGALQGLGFGIGGRYLTDQAGDLPNTFELPAYGVMDAAIYFERGRFRSQINLSNVLDTKYFGGSYDRLYVLPGEPFSASVTLEWSF